MNTNIEDKLAIEERIARYNHAIDSGDMVTWMDCWADDAIFDGIGKYLVGKPAIQVFADNYQRDYGSNMPAGRHFTVNIVSKINADQASSHSYLQLWSTGAKGARIAFTGVYNDTLVKVDGVWRFSSRKMVHDKPS